VPEVRLRVERRPVRYESANSRGQRGGHPWLSDDQPMETVQASRPVKVDGIRLGAHEVNVTHSSGASRRPYRIPLMAEIAALRGTNGLVAISTFSGCGGSCLGLEWAGYDVRWASEFIPAAAEVYRLNHPGVVLDTRDIRQVTGADIRAASGIGDGEIDLLEGSPPCAAFSTAGKREESWGKVRKYSDTTQRVDDLFDEFIRLVGELRPRAFVAENVSGLVKGVAKGYFKEILMAMKATGYRVEARLLDAQWLGVPQARQRIIFVGVREDLGKRPAFPKPLPYRYSLRDAIGDIQVPHNRSGLMTGNTGDDVTGSPAKTIKVGGGQPSHYAVVEPEADITRYAIGAEWDRLKQGGQSERYFNLQRASEASPSPTVTAEGARAGLATVTRYAIGAEWDRLKQGGQSERYFNLQRASEASPSPTVTAEGARAGLATVTHPCERRKFSIAELKRVCGFPDDFVLTGTYAQQWERLGRAVPPPMMRAVAEVLRDEVLL